MKNNIVELNQNETTAVSGGTFIGAFACGMLVCIIIAEVMHRCGVRKALGSLAGSLFSKSEGLKAAVGPQSQPVDPQQKGVVDPQQKEKVGAGTDPFKRVMEGVKKKV